jgi:putative SOS response-associated peptidase YedK
MCGRFTQKSERKIISLEFYIKDFLSDVLVNYNVAPSQDAGVIIHDDVYRYVRYRWGLVPFWSRDTKIGNRMINARAETVAEKPSFRNAFAKRRCLVPADGFYEWKRENGFKTPYYIYHATGKPMSFAGLWESWTPKAEKSEQHTESDLFSTHVEKPPPLNTFTIITTEANEKLKGLHDRMPVVITPAKRDVWLSPDTRPDQLEELLRPLPSEEIMFHEVSRMVNTPQNNSPECIEPIKK